MPHSIPAPPLLPETTDPGTPLSARMVVAAPFSRATSSSTSLQADGTKQWGVRWLGGKEPRDTPCSWEPLPPTAPLRPRPSSRGSPAAKAAGALPCPALGTALQHPLALPQHPPTAHALQVTPRSAAVEEGCTRHPTPAPSHLSQTTGRTPCPSAPTPHPAHLSYTPG